MDQEINHFGPASEHGNVVSAALHLAIEVVEVIGAVIIVISVLIGAWKLVVGIIRKVQPEAVSKVRFELGQRLVLALEFLIAADILKTVLSPSLQDLLVLGGTILIRTILSVSIAFELRHTGSTGTRVSETHEMQRGGQPLNE